MGRLLTTIKINKVSGGDAGIFVDGNIIPTDHVLSLDIILAAAE